MSVPDDTNFPPLVPLMAVDAQPPAPPVGAQHGDETPSTNPHANPWRPPTASPLVSGTNDPFAPLLAPPPPPAIPLEEPHTSTTQPEEAMSQPTQTMPALIAKEKEKAKKKKAQDGNITQGEHGTKPTVTKEPAKSTRNRRKAKAKQTDQEAIGLGSPPQSAPPPPLPAVPTAERTEDEPDRKRRRATNDTGNEGDVTAAIRWQDVVHAAPSQAGRMEDLTVDLTNLSPPPADGYYSDGGLSYVETENAMEVDQLPAPAPFSFVLPNTSVVDGPQTPPTSARASTTFNPLPPQLPTTLGNVHPTSPQTPTPASFRNFRFTRHQPATNVNPPPAVMSNQQPPRHASPTPGPSGHQQMPAPRGPALHHPAYITIRGPTAATRKPQNNWPAVHGKNAFFWTENMNAKQHEAWAEIARQQPALLAQFPGCGADEPETTGKVDKITKMIKDYLSVHRFVVTTPVAILKGKRNRAPYWFLIHDISRKDCNTLLEQEWLDTPDGTINCRPLTADNPLYAGAWRYARCFGAKDDNYTEVFVRAFQGEILQGIVLAYIAEDIAEGGHWSAHTLDEAYAEWLNTVYACPLNLARGENMPDPIVRLYVAGSTGIYL